MVPRAVGVQLDLLLLASLLLGVFSELITALSDHTMPPRSVLLGRAAFRAATAGTASVPYPGCDEVEDRAVFILLAAY